VLHLNAGSRRTGKMLKQASRVAVKKVKAVVHRTVDHLNEFLVKLQKLAGK
jgi:hypothetical protein